MKNVHLRKAKNADHLRDVMVSFELTPGQLADIVGIHTSTLNRWLRHPEETPQWTLLCMEALRRRQAQKQEQGSLIIARVDRHQFQSVAQILNLMQVPFAHLSEEGL